MTWIVHLVGAIHQPLHAAALFTTGAFPTGDAGGGRLTVDGSNLHALWDDAVAAGVTWYYMQQRAEELIAEYGDAGTEAATNLDFEDWLLESHELARSVAYSFQIRSTVQSFNERPRDAIPVRVGEDYIRRMREVSRRRLTEAGYRLGAWLNFFASQRD
ncbi:MAG: S1/P1 nuclease [Gammaproteobacteria bacterium]